jgi:hypothetical protein
MGEMSKSMSKNYLWHSCQDYTNKSQYQVGAVEYVPLQLLLVKIVL